MWQGRAITMFVRTMIRMDRSILWAGLHSTNFRTRAIQGIRCHFARLFSPVPVGKCEEIGGWTRCEVKYVNNIRNRGFLLLEHTKGIPNHSIAWVFVQSTAKVTLSFRYWFWESNQYVSTDESLTTPCNKKPSKQTSSQLASHLISTSMVQDLHRGLIWFVRGCTFVNNL